MANYATSSLKLSDTYVNTLPYNTCSTAAGTAAKTVSAGTFSLETGAMVVVKFTVTNTAANPTLNVSSTGAKAIYYNGAAIPAGHLKANKVYQFIYNGTQWDLVGDNDTTYALYKTGSTITLLSSDGATTSVTDDDTKVTVDSSLSSTSTNPIQNKVIKTELDKKLGKTTYEYNTELALGGTGKVCIGKFPMYDSNISVEIKSTTSTTYNGTLVIATQNINTTGGGTYTATVYGDASNSLTSSIKIHYGSGSNVFSVYIDLPGWSKNLLHIQCVALKGEPTDIATTVSEIPSNATIVPTNALTANFAVKSHTHTKSQISDFPTLATVATSGSYDDLSNKPTIPTLTDSTNSTSTTTAATPNSVKAAYDLAAAAQQKAEASPKNLGELGVLASTTELNYLVGTTENVQNQLNQKVTKGTLATVATSGSYNDLSNKPTIPTAYTHPSYTARTGKPTANQTPAFGGTATVSQITSDATGHVTAATDRTITIPSTLSNGTGTAGLIKTSSTVTSASGYTACPVISGVPYYKDTNTTYTSLKNPYAITFTGGATGTYDGSAAKTVNIPTAATIADGVVDLLKDRGDTIVGAVNSNNDITLVSGLADGVYTLKYENSDGTTTSLGYFNMSDGSGNITSYRNWFDATSATLNQRWSNSSYAWTTSSGTGHFVTDFIPVTLSTDTSNPTVMHFRGATYTNNAHIVFYNSSKSVINSATASTNGAGMQVSTTSVTTDENGDYQVSLGYKNGAFDSAWTSGVAYMRVGLYVSSSTLTTSSVQDVIITINELIDD